MGKQFRTYSGASLKAGDEHQIETEDGMISKEALKRLGRDQRQPLGTTSGYCRAMSRGLVDVLEEHDVQATTLETTVGAERAVHVCVLVASKDITDVKTDEGATIVDATIDQFNRGFYENGDVEACLGDLSDLPAVGIYPPDSPEREQWYNRSLNRG